jgi:secreted trypsin-like serine protease
MNALLLFIFIIFTSINSSLCTPYACNTSLSCGCSSATTVVTARIVGGEAAPNHAWTWMVSLQLNNAHRCGASLLTAEYAVTAAHCVYELPSGISELSILAGTNYYNDVTSSTVERRAITRIGIHPNYLDVNVTNDIAILQFSPLTITPNTSIGFICLPDPYQDPFQTGDNLITIGWGVTKEGSTTLSTYLQQVTVQAISSTSTNCITSGFTNSTIQFCAGVVGGGKGKLYSIFNFIKNTFSIS